MKKELSIRSKNKNKFVQFFISNWWISIITGALSFMFCGLPNFLNTNNAYGVIARTYTDNFHAYASGGTSVDFNAVYIILEDSSLFHSSNKTVIALLNTPQSIGGKVKLKYSNNLERTDKRVTKLIYNGVVVLDNPILPLIILLLSFLWFVFGGIRELVRIWKSV